MKLNLKRPLVVFDLETTGLDVVKDHVIQLSYIKVYPDGKEERKSFLINPCRSIPAEVQTLTGISDADVADAPKFKDIAVELYQTFKDCDFAGFNSNHFDIPMLAEEFLHSGIDFDFNSSALIDVQTIYHKMERRNLAAAYKFYCGRLMEEDFEAHRADQDTEATYRVLMGQLDKYSPENESDEERQLKNDVESLAEFSRTNDNLDFAGRIIVVNGREIFNFGKHKGQSVEMVFDTDPSYFSWMMQGDFPYNTKQVLLNLKKKYSKK